MKVIRIAATAANVVGSLAYSAQPGAAATHWQQSGANYGAINNYNNGYGRVDNIRYDNGNDAYGHQNASLRPFNNGSIRNNKLNIDSRQSSIDAQIQRGIASGRLTQIEASKLIRAQQRIVQLEANLRLSGNRLTVVERQRLNIELGKLALKTRQELLDRQVR